MKFEITSSQQVRGDKVSRHYRSAARPVSAPSRPPLVSDPHTHEQMCLCSHDCSRSTGWCIAAFKARLSVSLNSLSEIQQDHSQACRIRPPTGSATLHKSGSNFYTLSQPGTGKQQRKWALIYGDRHSHSRCSERSHMWRAHKHESSHCLCLLHNHTLTHKPEQLWHLWKCAEQEPVRNLLSIRYWGHMFRIE